jgi:hypothetical protein
VIGNIAAAVNVENIRPGGYQFFFGCKEMIIIGRFPECIDMFMLG